jgi:hypothetical protein
VAGEKLRLVPTDVEGHFTVEPPPDGFEPLRASDEELRRYGLPHRPDPKRYPQAARLWVRSMSRVQRFVTPKLRAKPEIVHGPPKILDNGTSSNWSGLISWGSAWDSIWGTWIVPASTVPPGGADDYFSSLWVGLNGASLFQAGTEQDATLSSGFFGGLSSSYYAWYEWFPAGGVQISGFDIAPGQTVTVMVGVVDPSDQDASLGPGLVNMLNVSSGVAITPIVVQIPTKDFNGNTIDPPITVVPGPQAVWILERPSLNDNGTLTPSALADYGQAIMNGGAMVKNADVLTVGENDESTLVNMIADNGVTVLSTVEESPELCYIFTGGPTA